MINKERLQTLAESIAHEKLPDGTWKMDYKNASEFYNLIKPYVQKAAQLSDSYDPEDAESDVMLHVFLSLKRWGPTYKNKPFYFMLKTKTNNVLTNRYHKRSAHKNFLNYHAQSYEELIQERSEFVRNGGSRHQQKQPATLPIDIVGIKERFSQEEHQRLREMIRRRKMKNKSRI